MTSTTSRVWFITGCSKGFGHVFADLLARAGEQVFATARDVSTLQDLQAAHPGRIRVGALDITRPEQIECAVQEALRAFGRIDVLLNNAGFGVIGPIEAISDAQTRAIFDTNFFGTLNVTRAVLPHLRARRSGHIFQMSSSHAWGGGPGIGLYSASKCALEGATEALAREVTPLGIRVTILQPGPYKTDFLGSGLQRAERPIEDYAAITQGVEAAVDAYHGKQPGDAAGIVPAMLAVLDSATPPLRLLLGQVATERAAQRLSSCEEENAAWHAVSLAADFAPADLPAGHMPLESSGQRRSTVAA